MAKKKELEEPTGSGVGSLQPELFPAEDHYFMLALWKTAAPTGSQVDMLYTLYRRYINPNQPRSQGTCSNCSGNINQIYSNMRHWHVNNQHLFAR